MDWVLAKTLILFIFLINLGLYRRWSNTDRILRKDGGNEKNIFEKVTFDEEYILRLIQRYQTGNNKTNEFK